MNRRTRLFMLVVALAATLATLATFGTPSAARQALSPLYLPFVALDGTSPPAPFLAP